MSATTAIILCATVVPSVWAKQWNIKSKPHNHDEAPVIVKRSTVKLIETFPTPGHLATPGSRARYSRVKYANRKGQTETVYVLEGELTCRSTERKTVEAIGLVIVPLDAFHNAIRLIHRAGTSKLNQVTIQIPRRAERRVEWEQVVGSAEVYEVAVVIDRVRFDDGSVWKAPDTEVVDIF